MRANANVHNERLPAQVVTQRIAIDGDFELLSQADSDALAQPVQPLHDRKDKHYGRKYGKELNGKVGT